MPAALHAWRTRSASSASLAHDASPPVAPLILRASDLASALHGYDLGDAKWQEPLNYVEYAEHGSYGAHPDGGRGGPHESGARVATVSSYCAAPEAGGATVFPGLGLKIIPERKSALFFSYKREDGTMDGDRTTTAL